MGLESRVQGLAPRPWPLDFGRDYTTDILAFCYLIFYLYGENVSVSGPENKKFNRRHI